MAPDRDGSTPEERLAARGWALPPLRRPAGDYVGWVRSGDLLFLSGQGADGYDGRVGAGVPLERAREAARACALNLLAQTRDALGALAHVRRVVKLLGFVACSADFTQAPQVIDGASEVFVVAFGDAGRHARAAIGAHALPLGFCVEVEAVLECEGVVP